jgi:hypothetical protein
MFTQIFALCFLENSRTYHDFSLQQKHGKAPKWQILTHSFCALLFCPVSVTLAAYAGFKHVVPVAAVCVVGAWHAGGQILRCTRRDIVFTDHLTLRRRRICAGEVHLGHWESRGSLLLAQVPVLRKLDLRRVRARPSAGRARDKPKIRGRSSSVFISTVSI